MQACEQSCQSTCQEANTKSWISCLDIKKECQGRQKRTRTGNLRASLFGGSKWSTNSVWGTCVNITGFPWLLAFAWHTNISSWVQRGTLTYMAGSEGLFGTMHLNNQYSLINTILSLTFNSKARLCQLCNVIQNQFKSVNFKSSVSYRSEQALNFAFLKDEQLQEIGFSRAWTQLGNLWTLNLLAGGKKCNGSCLCAIWQRFAYPCPQYTEDYNRRASK